MNYTIFGNALIDELAKNLEIFKICLVHDKFVREMKYFAFGIISMS